MFKTVIVTESGTESNLYYDFLLALNAIHSAMYFSDFVEAHIYFLKDESR